MENNIFEPNKNFNFSNISLAQPSSIPGNAYFTKILNNNKPFYIETPKCITKQGFVKNGKKIYCDLMFDNSNEEFIQWIENLETKCQELIFEKGDSWFQNKLDMNDIESAFTSPLKVYKSGKYYLMRVNTKMNYNTNIPLVKIYNESEIPLTIDDVNSETNIISIIEIQGIKFTTRNFQIEIEMKQSMIINTCEIFENCLIKKNINNVTNINDNTKKTGEKIRQETNNLEELNVVIKNEDSKIQFSKNHGIDGENEILNNDNQENDNQENDNQENDIQENKDDSNNDIELKVNEKQDEDLEKTINILNTGVDEKYEENDELKEFNINTDVETLESITLKKPNQVFYDIYKEARKKAKKAKKDAILAFLEAKNIKKTYMLDDFDESEDSEDSDLDNLSDYSDYSDSDNIEKEME